MELQVHQHFATHIDPSCSLHKATNYILYWIGTSKMMVPKKIQKCGNTGFGGVLNVSLREAPVIMGFLFV